MVVAFRTDSSVRIGTGHTIRCLTLADELAARGVECHFIQRRHPGHMISEIETRGFRVHALPEPPVRTGALKDGDYRAWAGVSEEEDAQACSEILEAIGADQVIVDHYGFGLTWHTAVRPVVRRIMVIDDLADRALDCDVLLDQNFVDGFGARYDGLVPDHCLRLSGPQFALLAPEYARAREFIGPRRGPLSRVLVFFGGSDSTDETGRALRVLSRPEFRHLGVDVVVGRSYEHGDALRALADERGRVTVHGPQPSLLPLMIQADIAIGAGGATTWERCCLGLPSVVIAIAANQKPASRSLADAGACILLGDHDIRGAEDYGDELAEALRSLLADPELLQQMGEIGWRLGDGIGARAVSEVLLPTDTERLSLRPARAQDVALYWRWANDPTVRSAALNSGFVEWSSHLRWFDERVTGDRAKLWVLETDRGTPLGQFRVELRGGRGIVAYSVDQAFRGRGLGHVLLCQGVRCIAESDFHSPLSCERKVTSESDSDMTIAPDDNKVYSLSVLSDYDSWINTYVAEMVGSWISRGHDVQWVHKAEALKEGDFLFLLGCSQLIDRDVRTLHRHNLVVHASALPEGRGWSPLTWQVLQGAENIPVSLIEAEAMVDSGPIYAQEFIQLNGDELIDELRHSVGMSTRSLCTWFVESFPEGPRQPRPQAGKPSYLRRRGPSDSRLDPEKSLASQFNLLRTVDNERYPAYFDWKGVRVQVQVSKVKE